MMQILLISLGIAIVLFMIIIAIALYHVNKYMVFMNKVFLGIDTKISKYSEHYWNTDYISKKLNDIFSLCVDINNRLPKPASKTKSHTAKPEIKRIYTRGQEKLDKAENS